jgi:hypothetical protein
VRRPEYLHDALSRPVICRRREKCPRPRKWNLGSRRSFAYSHPT